MSGKPKIDDKVITPAPGAEGATEKDPVQTPAPAETPAPEPQAAVQPDWVQAILDSNAALMASNEAVIAGLESFKEHAADFVEEIAEKASAGSGSEPSKPKQAKEVQVDITAEYVVAEGKSFRDKNNISKEFKSGESVSGLDEDRLKNLLNQGLIELAPSE